MYQMLSKAAMIKSQGSTSLWSTIPVPRWLRSTPSYRLGTAASHSEPEPFSSTPLTRKPQHVAKRQWADRFLCRIGLSVYLQHRGHTDRDLKGTVPK